MERRDTVPAPAAAKPAPLAVEPTPQPARPSTTFAERVAATGSGPASEDATESGRPIAHVDPHNGPIGRAQAAGGSDAIARMADRSGDEPLAL